MGSWKEKFERGQRTLKKARDAATQTVYQARTDAEILGAAALAGVVRGHYAGAGKKYEIGKTAKISPELVVALPLKLLAYTGIGGKATEDLHAIGIGPLAYLAGKRAEEHMVEKAKEKKTDKTKASNAGALPDPNRGVDNAVRAELRRRAAVRATA